MYVWLTFPIHDYDFIIDKSSSSDKFSISTHYSKITLLTSSYFSFCIPLVGNILSNTIARLHMTRHLPWCSHSYSLKRCQVRYHLNITSICIKEVFACEHKLKHRTLSRSFLLSPCSSCVAMINITTIP